MSARHSFRRTFLNAYMFLKYLAQRFVRDRCTQAAASLAYTSLLALVPLMTVVFVALSAFPAFQDWREAVENFVFRNFVPALGEQVQGYIAQFTEKARRLQAAGVTVLLVTVLMMMSTVESTFNVIWNVERRRPLMVRFLVYWAVLTLGPILIGTGMVVTSYLFSIPGLTEDGAGPLTRADLLAVVPLIASTFAFVLFFKLIPYRPVPFANALVGGIVASLLFEAAKQGFAIYVTRFPAQQAIYGAFATLPIFLIWIYASWLVVLFGAEVTKCLTTYPLWRSSRHDSRHPERDPAHCAFLILRRLYTVQVTAQGLSERELANELREFSFEQVSSVLQRLDLAAWIGRNERYQWILLRDLSRVHLGDLLQLIPSIELPRVLSESSALSEDPESQQRLQKLESVLREGLNVPLAALCAV